MHHKMQKRPTWSSVPSGMQKQCKFPFHNVRMWLKWYRKGMRACLPLLSSFFQLSLQGTFFKFLFLFFRCHIKSKDVSSSHMGEETEPYHLFPPQNFPPLLQRAWDKQCIARKASHRIDKLCMLMIKLSQLFYGSKRKGLQKRGSRRAFNYLHRWIEFAILT